MRKAEIAATLFLLWLFLLLLALWDEGVFD